jgi:cell division ATPase FtsA
VLTGGASQIPGLDGLAPKILGQQVRIGRPLRVQGLPQAATGAAFASAVGLCLFRGAPAGRVVGFRNSGGPACGPVAQESCKMVQGQLVTATSSRGGKMLPMEASERPDFVGEICFFRDLGAGFH